MGNPHLRTAFGQIELRPVSAPKGAPEGMRVFVLLPALDELLGVPGFGLCNPIQVMPAAQAVLPAMPGATIH